LEGGLVGKFSKTRPSVLDVQKPGLNG